MRRSVRCAWLAACLCGLHAEIISHLHLPIEDIPKKNCVFPFTYGDVVYHSCISVHSDFSWCSLDSHFRGRWRYCQAHDPPKCVFPFRYKRQKFYNCTKKGYILNRSWCSLTENYNKDRKWKQCSPLNT